MFVLVKFQIYAETKLGDSVWVTGKPSPLGDCRPVVHVFVAPVHIRSRIMETWSGSAIEHVIGDISIVVRFNSAERWDCRGIQVR